MFNRHKILFGSKGLHRRLPQEVKESANTLFANETAFSISENKPCSTTNAVYIFALSEVTLPLWHEFLIPHSGYKMEFIQSIFLSTFLVVFMVQFPLANARNLSSRQSNGVKSGLGRRSLRMEIPNPTNYTAVNDTASQDNVQNQSSQFVYGKTHPCNSIQTSAMKYKGSNVECRRWQNSELQQQMNCLGMFNHQYLAASFQEALQFKDLDTGKRLDLSNSYILDRSSYTHHKRDVDIDPGETLIGQCHAKKSPTESGNLRICPSCSAITRQPSTPRRFPEYINEVLCDPQMVSNYLPGIDAFCIQKTFTLDLLQFDGDWELDPALSAEAGHDVYTEKWELYTQTIRRHCACELLPSSPMAIYL
ncbi:hypothetical protein ACROYT_G004376 [Oculina patagonica]